MLHSGLYEQGIHARGCVPINWADASQSGPFALNHTLHLFILFYWQSTTAEQSPTGQRFIHHRERGSRVLLFVREFKTDSLSGGAATHTFLGTANYLRHEDSRSMNIT